MYTCSYVAKKYHKSKQIIMRNIIGLAILGLIASPSFAGNYQSESTSVGGHDELGSKSVINNQGITLIESGSGEIKVNTAGGKKISCKLLTRKESIPLQKEERKCTRLGTKHASCTNKTVKYTHSFNLPYAVQCN